MTFQTVIAYMAMCLLQSYGPEILHLLYGEEVMLKATQPHNDVNPDGALEELCKGYDAHHWDKLSNSCHAAGMIISVILLYQCVTQRKVDMLINIPPVWYLYAWAGHFLIQQDIPAVFVYGMTWKGWVSGEYCAVKALVEGRTVTDMYGVMATGLLVGSHLMVDQSSVEMRRIDREGRERRRQRAH